METFYSRLLQGKIKKELIHHEFDDEVDIWHKKVRIDQLHEHLGMPSEVYDQVVMKPEYLQTLFDKDELTVEDLIVLLKTMPQKTKVIYDWGQTLRASDVEFDEEMDAVHLNR